MAVAADEELNFADLINKCRLCFRQLSEDHKFVPIDEIVKQKFFMLTSVVLVEDDAVFSKMACHLCAGDLEVFFNFRSDMIKRQERLIRAHPDPAKFNRNKPEPFEVLAAVKIENELDEESLQLRQVHGQVMNFVDCTIFEPVEVMRVPVVEKEEVESDQHEDDDDDENSDDSRDVESYDDDENSNEEDYEPYTKASGSKARSKPSSSGEKKGRSKFKPTEEAQILLVKDFKQLLKKNKSKQLACPGCFKVMHRDSMREHIHVVHFKQNKYTCDICSFSTPRYARLMWHKKSRHGENIDSKYEQKKTTTKQCYICGSFIKNWRRHVMKVHLNIRNFSCDLCGIGTFFKSDMQKHIQVHIRKEKKKTEKFYCESCGLEFDKRFHLRSHIRNKHTAKERSHHCSICDKSFFSAENLKKHVESHGQKDMPCEFCGKLFSCMNNLRTHLYYHSDPKFVCDFAGCDKKFYKRKSWRTHVKTHVGLKDFHCDQCDKHYFSQNDLSRHKFSIHERLRFICDVPDCSGSFSRREYYKKHVLAHHQSCGQDYLEDLLIKVRHSVPVRKI